MFSYLPFFCSFHHDRSAVFASYFLLIKIILVPTRKLNLQRPCSTGKSHKPTEGLNLPHEILKPGNFVLEKKKSRQEATRFCLDDKKEVGQMPRVVSSLSFRLNKQHQNCSFILSLTCDECCEDSIISFMNVSNLLFPVVAKPF